MILSFDCAAGGADPTNSLIYDGSMFYGMARAGGAGVENIFKIVFISKLFATEALNYFL